MPLRPAPCTRPALDPEDGYEDGRMRLDWPPGLVALVLVPLAIAAWLACDRRRAPRAVRFTNLEVLASVCPGRPRARTYAPAALALLALTCALAALARPAARIAVARAPASIVLAVDMSGSMAADDVQPSRIAAAKASDPELRRRAAEAGSGRSRHVLLDRLRRDAAHPRPHACCSTRSRSRPRPARERRSATRSRARSSCSRLRGSPRAPAPTTSTAADGDPAALRRRPDARHG